LFFLRRKKMNRFLVLVLIILGAYMGTFATAPRQSQAWPLHPWPTYVYTPGAYPTFVFTPHSFPTPDFTPHAFPTPDLTPYAFPTPVFTPYAFPTPVFTPNPNFTPGVMPTIVFTPRPFPTPNPTQVAIHATEVANFQAVQTELPTVEPTLQALRTSIPTIIPTLQAQATLTGVSVSSQIDAMFDSVLGVADIDGQ
jgi:hypothetical protein